MPKYSLQTSNVHSATQIVELESPSLTLDTALIQFLNSKFSRAFRRILWSSSAGDLNIESSDNRWMYAWANNACLFSNE